MNKWIMLIVSCALAGSAWGQAQKSFHEIFQLDSVKTVQLDLFGEPEVKAWPGNNIMIETKVRLFDASDVILGHFVEAGRYQVTAEVVGETLNLVSLDKERKTIKTTRGECFEEVKTVVYMPDTFKESGKYHYESSTDDN